MLITVVVSLLLLLTLSDSYITGPVLSRTLNRHISKVPASILHAKRRTTLSKGRTAEAPQEATVEKVAESMISPISTQKEDIVPKSITVAATRESSVSPVISTAAPPSNKGRQLSQRIQDDISDFERIGALREKKVVVEENALAKTLKNIFSAIFIADFFVVIVFLIWFLAAAAMQSTNPFLLEKFQVTFHTKYTLYS